MENLRPIIKDNVFKYVGEDIEIISPKDIYTYVANELGYYECSIDDDDISVAIWVYVKKDIEISAGIECNPEYDEYRIITAHRIKTKDGKDTLTDIEDPKEFNLLAILFDIELKRRVLSVIETRILENFSKAEDKTEEKKEDE